MALHRLAMLMVFAPLLLFSSAERASTAPPVRLETEALTGDADVTVAGQVAAASQATVQRDDRVYPFYMPMQGLRPPAVIMRVRCDASRAAGREVFDRPSAAAIEGRIEGGYEFVYEAYDGAGRPCVYPFAPSMPQIVGQTNGTQYIFRSSVPGVQVTFRTNDAWATINPRLFELGPQRIHFEMRDIALDFPGAGEAKGAVHLEVLDVTRPGLITAVIRRSTIFGGKNAIFVPGGETMVLIEDSIIRGNVGDSVDQEHGTYINGTLVTHVRNSTWYGQKGWIDVASGHQLKDKVYLSVFQNTLVDSFRSEPHVFRLNMQGLGVEPGTPTVIGNEQTTRAQQRMVSLAFNTRGTLRRAYTNEGWTYSDPVLPPEMQWVKDRDAFIRHALGLIGR
ncbi:hypothetical protein [Blastomonas sp. CCH8-A3]|uniref:hypothetical protein n=1 Tax=Blastomonas sp. CCH8-A3 TaxID=1768743 RepID=UPI0008270DD2|nr:hypothetical protein [Blastomonas sp. CCH8-A3]